MTTIQRIDVLSIGRVSLILGGAVGLVIGVLYFLLVLLAGSLVWAIAAWVGSVIGYMLITSILGMLYAWIYNIASSLIGGIKVELVYDES